MTRKEHPVWEDELMPYVDGQLDATAASGITEHLEQCQDCAAVVRGARGLSQQMAAWTVEEAPQEMKTRVLAELRPPQSGKPHGQWPTWWSSRRAWTLGLSGAFAALVLAFVVGPFGPDTDIEPFGAALGPPSVQGQQGQQGQGQPGKGADENLRDFFDLERAEATRPQTAAGPLAAPSAVGQAPGAPSGPMIIRTARLIIIASEFEKARARIEAVVQDSQGHLDLMTVRSETGSGKTLTASLRLPAERMESGLIELRKIGKVREESQNSSDVTSQYVDLQARLVNARNTEQRLMTLQRERTGKLPDVVDVEREISRVREQIERMVAQQKDMANKAQFATIHIEMSEEYRAAIEPATPGAGVQLRNATIDGYHAALDSLLGVAMFLLRYGPALLLWSALLLPVLLLARRLHATLS